MVLGIIPTLVLGVGICSTVTLPILFVDALAVLISTGVLLGVKFSFLKNSAIAADISAALGSWPALMPSKKIC